MWRRVISNIFGVDLRGWYTRDLRGGLGEALGMIRIPKAQDAPLRHEL